MEKVNQNQQQVFNVLNFLFVFLFFNCTGQVKQECKGKSIEILNNKTLPYDVAMVSCDTCVPIRNLGYRVVINLQEKDEKEISKIDTKCWMVLLSDSSSDWAANLMLYSLYDEDAILLSRVNEKTWRTKMKAKDIKKWELKLKK
ncbi:MAG: signal recognition particle [Bacteroidia bacterium]|nr:signal recognition particle [Bacteroidia bacterium]